MLTARARGVRERTVLVRHALRHALLPAVTLAGWLFGILLGGAVIVEQVFGRPGLGQVTLTAVTSRDMPVVLAVVPSRPPSTSWSAPPPTWRTCWSTRV